MTRVITGLFDSRAEAEQVVTHLTQHDGINRSSIRVYGAEDTTGATTGMAGDKGFWASLKDLFVPDEDRYTYSEGIRRGGVVVSAEVDDAHVDHAMNVFEEHGAVDLEERETEWRNSGWTGGAGQGMAATATTGMGADPRLGTVPPATGVTGTTATTAARTGGEEVIPIVEENVRVGKRDVERGRVRVRSYIVETPVTEQVALRSEHVEVERRPVDRPVTDADKLFQERTIEATEHAEEAVVAKEARVKEELVIHKDVTERTETVRDTVRRTEVEVEDDRTAGTATTTGTTTTGTTTAGTTTTTGTTSGAGVTTPRTPGA